jgi:hypothetical protein
VTQSPSDPATPAPSADHPSVVTGEAQHSNGATCPWCSAVLPTGELTRCPNCGAALDSSAAPDVANPSVVLLAGDGGPTAGVEPDLGAIVAESLIVLSPAEELEAVMPPSPELRREMEHLSPGAGSAAGDAVPAVVANLEPVDVDTEALLALNDADELEAVAPPSPEVRREMERLGLGDDRPPRPRGA